MASKVTKKAVSGNMHIDARVIEVIFVKSELKFYLLLFGGHHGLRNCLLDTRCTWILG